MPGFFQSNANHTPQRAGANEQHIRTPTITRKNNLHSVIEKQKMKATNKIYSKEEVEGSSLNCEGKFSRNSPLRRWEHNCSTQKSPKTGGTGGMFTYSSCMAHHTRGRALQGGEQPLPCSSSEPKDDTILKILTDFGICEKIYSLILRTHMKQR